MGTKSPENTIAESSTQKVKNLVMEFFHDEEVKVVWFGSRVMGTNNRYSDIDVGLLPKANRKVNAFKLSELKETLENLNIPYKVDVVDLSTVSEEFRKNALSHGKIWRT